MYRIDARHTVAGVCAALSVVGCVRRVRVAPQGSRPGLRCGGRELHTHTRGRAAHCGSPPGLPLGCQASAAHRQSPQPLRRSACPQRPRPPGGRLLAPWLRVGARRREARSAHCKALQCTPGKALQSLPRPDKATPRTKAVDHRPPQLNRSIQRRKSCGPGRSPCSSCRRDSSFQLASCDSVSTRAGWRVMGSTCAAEFRTKLSTQAAGMASAQLVTKPAPLRDVTAAGAA
jgi:hypothetical protein